MVLCLPSLKSLWSRLRLSSPESKPKARAGSRPAKPLTLNTIAAAAVSEESLPFAEPKSPRGAPKGSTNPVFGVVKNQPHGPLLGHASSNRTPPGRTFSNRTTPRSSPHGSPESTSTKTTTPDYTGQVEKVGPVDTTHSLLESYPAKVNGDTDLGRVTVLVLRTLASGSGLDESSSQAWMTAVRDHIREKINVRKKINGPLVKYIGFVNIDGAPAILKEFVESTSAKDHLAQKSMKERRRLILGFAEALQALHYHGTTHGSIEPHQFIVDKKGRPMIDGWWFDRLVVEELEKVSPSDGYRGSARYTAPEVLESNKTNFKSDVYSFALVALELMTGKQPFSSTQQEVAAIGQIKQGTAPFGKDDAELRNDPWWPTLESCLSRDPADRPLMNKVSTDLSTTLPRGLFSLDS